MCHVCMGHGKGPAHGTGESFWTGLRALRQNRIGDYHNMIWVVWQLSLSVQAVLGYRENKGGAAQRLQYEKLWEGLQ